MSKEELTQKNTNETSNKNLDELKTILFGKEKTDISDQVSKIQSKLESIENIELFKKHFNDPAIVKLLNIQISNYLKENSKKETITKSVSKALPEAITQQLETNIWLNHSKI
jgi:GTP-dependent phosphoenolpyruvate carboxykinase